MTVEDGSAPGDLPTYPRTARNTPTRGRDRASWDRDQVHAILDATPVCHLAYDTPDGPITIPTTFARQGELVVVHCSSAAHLASLARRDHGGVEVCLTVTLVDAWVLARSGMHHSMNYRCVVVRGRATVVEDEPTRRAGLAAVLDAVWPQRSEHCRAPNARELAATTVFHLPLEVVSAKVRAEGADDEPADLDLPYWAGVVPVSTVIGTPVANDDLAAGITLPGA